MTIALTNQEWACWSLHYHLCVWRLLWLFYLNVTSLSPDVTGRKQNICPKDNPDVYIIFVCFPQQWLYLLLQLNQFFLWSFEASSLSHLGRSVTPTKLLWWLNVPPCVDDGSRRGLNSQCPQPFQAKAFRNSNLFFNWFNYFRTFQSSGFT